jgi:hypothetical protein
MLIKFVLFALLVLCLFIIPWAVERSITGWEMLEHLVDQPATKLTPFAAHAAGNPLDMSVDAGPSASSWEGFPASFYKDLVEHIVRLMAISTAIAATLGAGFFGLQRYLTRKIAGSTVAFEAKLASFADQVTTLHVVLPKSVFLKPIADEAALALAWTSAMASLMQSASTTLFWFLQRIRDTWLRIPAWIQAVVGMVFMSLWSVGAFMIFLPLANGLEISSLKEIRAMFFQDFWTSGAALDERLLGWMMALVTIIPFLSLVIVFALLAIILVLLIVAFMAAAAAGSLSPLMALFFEFSVEAVPTGNHHLVLVDVRTKSPSSGRISRSPLNHSALYESPGAISAVIEALAGFRSYESRSATT